ENWNDEGAAADSKKAGEDPSDNARNEDQGSEQHQLAQGDAQDHVLLRRKSSRVKPRQRARLARRRPPRARVPHGTWRRPRPVSMLQSPSAGGKRARRAAPGIIRAHAARSREGGSRVQARARYRGSAPRPPPWAMRSARSHRTAPGRWPKAATAL